MPVGAAGSWSDPVTELGATVGAKRGFATSVKSYYDIANGYYVGTHSFYDQFGNVRKVRDGRGNDTETLYDDDYAFAYPTSVTTAVPDSTGTYGSDTAFTTSSTVYDFDTFDDRWYPVSILKKLDKKIRFRTIYVLKSGGDALLNCHISQP